MVLLGQDTITHQSNSARRVDGPGDDTFIHHTSKLYIGNLASDLTEDELKDFFTQHGIVPSTVTKIVLKRGFAFVEFVNQKVADTALEHCNGKPLMNTLVRMEPAIRNESFANKTVRRLVQLLFTNCSVSMNPEGLKNLILESRIHVVSVEEFRPESPGSTSFVVRVANMKQATEIMSAWNNRIIQGSRMQIRVIDEPFVEAAAGDAFNQNHSQLSQSHFFHNKGGHLGSNGNVDEGECRPDMNMEPAAGATSEIDIPLRVLIPNEFIGAIIGRGGSTIRAISKGTGARVDIFRNSNRSFDLPEKPISISGAPENATQACKKIMEIMAQEAVHQRGREQGGDLALKIFIPNTVVGRIIGKGGAVIKEIMEETQSKIHISNVPDFLEHGLGIVRTNRIVTVRGSIEGMSEAESIISGKLKEAFMDGKVREKDLEFGYNYQVANNADSQHSNQFYPQQPAYGGGNHYPATSSSRYPVPMHRRMFPLSLNSSHDGVCLSRPETSYMYVPDESVGALIGRNGSSIREIIHSSGASIKVLEGVVIMNEYPFRRVIIHGGVDSLFLAEYFIYQRVTDERGGACPMDDPQLTIEMTVPSGLVGRLIGKGGANIREIQRQTYCRIKFLTEPELSIPPPEEGETYVRITGTAYGFLNAQKKIRTLLVKEMSKAFSISNNEGNGSRNEYEFGHGSRPISVPSEQH